MAPSGIISHQAPGLILKVKSPKKFDGTALCLGGLIPDFNAIFELIFPISVRNLSHSIIGQILWTIPLTIIATIIFSRLIAPVSANIASQKSFLFGPWKYFGIDKLGYLKEKKFDKRFYIVAVY